jgi:hypothetical protein
LRHIVKIAALLAGLLFLFWWGWWGNFIFSPGSLFHLSPGVFYYNFSLGSQNLGHTRRVALVGAPEDNFAIVEDTAISLDLPGLKGNALLHSHSLYGPDGRVIEATFTSPNLSPAKIAARVRGGFLIYSLELGTSRREFTLRVPPEGPILLSGLVPWLSRQRELPLGKVLLTRILDPVNMSFQTVEVVITDETAASEEIETYKVTARVGGQESSEWMDSLGHLTRLELARLDANLTSIGDEGARAAAENAMAVAGSDLLAVPPALVNSLPGLISTYFPSPDLVEE